MKVLLVLNNTEVKNLRVMVRLTKKKVIKRVIDLLEENNDREVFDLVMNEGQVVDYFPQGKPLSEEPVVTLTQEVFR